MLHHQTVRKIDYELVKNARTWLGTPWRPMEAIKGLGVDCINFLWQSAYETGIELPTIPERYGYISIGNEIEKYLFKNLELIDYIDVGSVLLFRFSGYNNHVGIATSPNTFIHASLHHGKVLEFSLDAIYLRCLKGKWRLKE